jgi:hypothetical protein
MQKSMNFELALTSPKAIAERSLRRLELVVRRWKNIGLPVGDIITLQEAALQVFAHNVEMRALDSGVLGQIELACLYGILDEGQKIRARKVLGDYAIYGQYSIGLSDARRIQASID